MARRTWLNYPATDTPTSAALFNDLEKRKPEAEYMPVNPRDPPYNATGLGAADDTVALQAAINAASAGGFDSVFISAGVYRITAPLQVPNFIHISGAGQSTLIRCEGNFYAFAFDPGHRSSVDNLHIEAITTQSSGGAFDYTEAGSNIHLSRIYFGNNLYRCINCAPNTIQGVYSFDRLRWNGITGVNTAIYLGDGTNLVTDVSFSRIKGTANTAADVVQWFDIAKNVDTPTFVDNLFFRGTNGMVLGSRGGSGEVTGLEADLLCFDMITNKAIDLVAVRDATFGPGCMIQTCGTASNPAIHFQDGTVLAKWMGTVRQSVGEGIVIEDAANWVRIIDAEVYDNNTSNTAALANIHVKSPCAHFQISGCLTGNFVALATGHAKYGILIDAGGCDQYIIGNNFHYRNETTPFLDGGTGVIKTIGPQIAVAADGTTAVQQDVRMATTQTIQDTGGADRVAFGTSGFFELTGLFDVNPVSTITGTAAQSANLMRFRRSATLKSAINSQGAFMSDDSAQGIILKDTQGTPHYWRVTVSTTGVLTTTDLGTTRPD